MCYKVYYLRAFAVLKHYLHFTTQVMAPGFTRFYFNMYYILLRQYLQASCNIRSHYISALSQYAFIDLNLMAYFTSVYSCKGNSKAMSIFIMQENRRFVCNPFLAYVGTYKNTVLKSIY